MWPGPGGYSIPSHIFAGGGGRNSLLRRRDSFWLSKCGRQGSQDGVAVTSGWALQRAFLHVNHSLSYTFVVNIVAVAVCFLVSLPFPINCSYLKPGSLPFVPPVLLPGQLWGWKRGMGSK